MERMKTSRPSSKAAVALRVLAFLLLAAFAAVFARQVLLCRSALESIPMLLEYPELFRAPIVRNGKNCTVGYCPETWETWLAAEKI